MATETLKPVSFNLSADDESLLIAYFGVKVKDQILELHEKILANPTTKPDTFWPIYTSKIKDRALRGAIDYAVRRIFNSKLYTIVLDGELVAIRAALGGRDSLGSNATYPDFSCTDMVTFVVGKGEQMKEVLVHKDIACYSSPVLYAAFNGAFKEGHTRGYNLKDTHPVVFKHLVQWMYRNKLVLPCHEKQMRNYTEEWSKEVPDYASLLEVQLGDDDIEIDKYCPEFPYLVRLWVLADKLQIPGLMSCIEDEFIGYNCYPYVPTASFDYIYDNTNPGSRLRRWAVTLCGKLTNDQLEILRDHFPNDLIFELMLRYNGRPQEASTCNAWPS